MNIINLTPHDINLIVDGKEIILPRSGKIARVEVTREKTNTFLLEGVGVVVNRSKFGNVQDLPSFQEGVFLLVSRLVAEALPNRKDLLMVDETIRDEAGKIIGAKSLAQI